MVTADIGCALAAIKSCALRPDAPSASPNRATCVRVASLSQVLTVAMPIAPPRLRIRLNSPEADRSSGPWKAESAIPTLGTMHSITNSPRASCGTRNS